MQPDWTIEAKRLFEWAPGKSLLIAVRAARRHRSAGGLLSRVLGVLAKRRVQFWSVVAGAHIPPEADIAGGLQMPHPNGIVVHEKAVIGANCMIMQQVTIGQLADGSAPRLGNGVYVGAGAKILGGVVIGDNARIGANAVVLADVPANATAVGIPARLVRR